MNPRKWSPAWLQVMEAGGKARVVFVAPGGPAERAGLAVGDAVQALNGQPVNLAQKQCALTFAQSLACMRPAILPSTVTIPYWCPRACHGAPHLRVEEVACCPACSRASDSTVQGSQPGAEAVGALRSMPCS